MFHEKDEDAFPPDCAAESESEVKFGAAELVFVFKSGQGNVDPFLDPAEDSGETFDRSKYRLFKNFKNDDGGPEARRILGEITAYAAAVMRDQYRTHCYILLVIGSNFRIVRWDRAGSIVTRAVDYKKSPDVLHGFLWRYANASPTERGFDMSHVDATKQEKEQLRALVRKNVLLQYFGTDEDGIGAKSISSKEVEKKISMHYSEDRVAKLPVFDEMTGTVQHCVVSFPCSAPTDVVGNGTRGYWAARYSGETSEPELVFLKDTWRRVDVRKEGKRYEEIGAVKAKGGQKGKPAKAHPVNVPTMLCHGDVRTMRNGKGIPRIGPIPGGTPRRCKLSKLCICVRWF